MEWTDEGIVLGARPHGETRAIAELFCRAHGRVAGLVHGGAGRKRQAVLQPGTLVQAGYRARLSEDLGAFATLEPIAPWPARAFDDSAALAAIAAACALIRAATAERSVYAQLFDGACVLLSGLGERALWPAVYCRFELGLLAAAGYGLDLSACALSGAREGLAFVSPKSGRAATAEAAGPHADKLLALPAFLTDPEAALAPGDVADALALCGHFLERRLFDRVGEGLPDSRRRMIEALGFSGRL